MLWKKAVIGLIIGLVIIGNVVGCQPAADTQKSKTRTITDMAGGKVEVPMQIHKIAVVPIPWASVIYAIDGTGERIAGMHPSARKAMEGSVLDILAPELKGVSTAFIKGGFAVNTEELIKLEPDVVIQWDDQQEEIKKMENAGIPVIAIKYGTQEYLESGITLVGELLGKEARASEIIRYHHETLENISSRIKDVREEKKPKAFYLRDEQLKTAGKNSYNNFWMEATGAVNVAADIPAHGANVNMEQIIAWNPQIIYISNFCELQPEDILENKIKGQDWSGIDAVKNNRVYKIPLGLYRWDPPSVESPLMLKWLAQIHHPDIFGDYSMVTETKGFYKKFFNYDITDEKVAEILRVKK